MHELSIASAIVDTALRHAHGRRVTLVSMRIGSLRQVVPDSLAFYFEIIARDTLCEGARLEHEALDAMLRCPSCSNEWDPMPPPLAQHGIEPGADPLLPYFRCRECGAAGARVIRGDELEVESIEVADDDRVGAST